MLLEWKNNAEFVTCDTEHCLTFWDIDLPKPAQTAKAHEKTINALKIDQSGTYLATASTDSLIK